MRLLFRQLARVIVCLLLSIAAGCAVYVVGAVVWSIIDPLGVGPTLIFTLPPAIALAAAPALLASIGVINRALLPTPRESRAARTIAPPAPLRTATRAVTSASPHPSPLPRGEGARTRQPQTSPSLRDPADAELVLA